MIKYLGSKRVIGKKIFALLPYLLRDRHASFLDAFSGTARIGMMAKEMGLSVTSNDAMAYAATLATAHVEADAREDASKFRAILPRLQAVTPIDGFMTQTYARESRFFTEDNAKQIDGIRRALREWPEFQGEENRILRAVALTSLIEAADRVDSTVGVQMAYLKQYAKRALLPLELRVPEMVPTWWTQEGGPVVHRTRQGDAAEACRKQKYDIIYLDPPYNQHSYLGNYHIWETLCLDDNPEVYGVARKRIDVKSRKSDFNSKIKSQTALFDVLQTAADNSRVVLLSYSQDGFVDQQALIDEFNRLFPRVAVQALRHKKYVGTKIGIHNKKGEVVGVPGETHTREFVFIGTHDTEQFDKVAWRLL